MSPNDSDIRRRNVCREVIIVNKSALVGDFVHNERTLYTDLLCHNPDGHGVNLSAMQPQTSFVSENSNIANLMSSELINGFHIVDAN
jgi:hypothetical protein